MSMPASAPPSPPTRAPTFAIAILAVAAFASAANMRVIDPLLVQLAHSFDVSVGAASIASTVFLFANGVFVLVHGPFGDRYGKMPVVTIACMGAALCCVLSALSASLGWLTMARFLTGVTSSAIIPLAIAWLGDNVSYEKRQATLACSSSSASAPASPEKPISISSAVGGASRIASRASASTVKGRRL